MRILAGIGIAVLLFATADVGAEVIREVAEKKTKFESRIQLSKTEYSRPVTRKTFLDPNVREVRSPSRIKFERAPQKLRRKSHFTEGP